MRISDWSSDVCSSDLINPILFLEDLGFCPKGEGGRFVSGGRIAPGGDLPVNTNGGGLSCVHPGMYGLFALAEAADQLMGTAGEHQIDRTVDLSRSEEHTSELQSLMRISYAVFCLKKKHTQDTVTNVYNTT